MPDAETILAFIAQVLTEPLTHAGTLVGTFFIALFVMIRTVEIIAIIFRHYFRL